MSDYDPRLDPRVQEIEYYENGTIKRIVYRDDVPPQSAEPVIVPTPLTDFNRMLIPPYWERTYTWPLSTPPWTVICGESTVGITYQLQEDQ